MGNLLSKLRGKDAAQVKAAEPSEALIAALQRLLAYLYSKPDAFSLSPALVADVAFKIGTFSRTAGTLQLEASDVAICLDDAEGVLHAVEIAGDCMSKVGYIYLQRLDLDLDRLNGSEKKVVDRVSVHTMTTTRNDDEIVNVATAYGEDARRERQLASRSIWLATLLLGGVTASAYWLTLRASNENHSIASLAGPALICILLSVFSLVLLRRAAGHTRSSREYIRLERGLRAIPAYLATLPPEARHLVRAVMTQTLFPRLLEDDDPERHIEFPDSATILTAVAPTVFAREEEEA